MAIAMVMALAVKSTSNRVVLGRVMPRLRRRRRRRRYGWPGHTDNMQTRHSSQPARNLQQLNYEATNKATTTKRASNSELLHLIQKYYLQKLDALFQKFHLQQSE